RGCLVIRFMAERAARGERHGNSNALQLDALQSAAPDRHPRGAEDASASFRARFSSIRQTQTRILAVGLRSRHRQCAAENIRRLQSLLDPAATRCWLNRDKDR